MNRNYVRGRAKEYRVKAKLEKEGWTVLRTAGSHGPFDLVAIKRPRWSLDEGQMRLIQCKSGKSQERESKKALEGIRLYGGQYEVEVEVV